MQRQSEAIPEIKALLQSRVADLCHALLPEGHRSGNVWIARSRAHDKKTGGLWVYIGGPSPGVWSDAVAGETGDVIALIGYLRFGSKKNTRDALSWAREFLGLRNMTPEQRQRQVDSSRHKVAEGEAAQAAQLEKDRKRAFAMWLDAKKLPFIGSPADAYLMSRGIDVRQLTRLPGELGWLPDAYHLESGRKWPCLLAGMSNDAGATVAIHRTWLRPDGSGKAPVEPERKIWPTFKGCCIRLWRGESKLPIKEAAANGLRETLVVCEGVEDGLSSVLAAPEFRTWSVGTLGNLQSLQLPECVDRVIIWRDNDWAKPQAAKQFEKGVEALLAQGRQVSIARSTIGKDPNDALRGVA